MMTKHTTTIYTAISLEHYIDIRVKDLADRLDDLLDAARLIDNVRAANVTQTAQELKDKLLEMNQFRTQIDNERGSYVTQILLDAKLGIIRAEANTISDSNEKRIRLLEDRIANYDGRLWAVGAGWTVITLVVLIVLHFWQ
jgi:vacuolar-type H+-ATPase subunit H